MVPASASSTSGSKGLSSLDAVRRRLEEDQARSRLSRAGPAPSAASAYLRQSTETAVAASAKPREVVGSAPVPAQSSGAGAEPSATSTGVQAAGGAARAASFLKSVEGGRAPTQEAAALPPVEIPLATVASAVTHPGEATTPVASEAAAAPTIPRAPPGAPPQRPAPRSAPGRPAPVADSFAKGEAAESFSGGSESGMRKQPKSVMDFRSNPDNFMYILRFLRDGKGWQAPEQADARESLREEALYFGCMALVSRLDAEQSGMRQGSGGAVEGSAMATDMAELGERAAAF